MQTFQIPILNSSWILPPRLYATEKQSPQLLQLTASHALTEAMTICQHVKLQLFQLHSLVRYSNKTPQASYSYYRKS